MLKEPALRLLDFTRISRGANTTTTSLYVEQRDQNRCEWLRVGQVEMHKRDRNTIWTLSSYLLDATDFEHDSAYLFRLNLIGVGLHPLGLGNGVTRISAWLEPDHEEFHVPDEHYDPLKLPETQTCPSCKGGEGEEPHLMVPPGFYIPKPNPVLHAELFALGARITIITGPTKVMT